MDTKLIDSQYTNYMPFSIHLKNPFLQQKLVDYLNNLPNLKGPPYIVKELSTGVNIIADYHLQGLLHFSNFNEWGKRKVNTYNGYRRKIGRELRALYPDTRGSGVSNFEKPRASHKHLINHYKYLCKGPGDIDKHEKLDPIVIQYGGPFEIYNQVMIEHELWWEDHLIKHAKKKVKKKNKTVGETYFEYMENIPFELRNNLPKAIHCTTMYFANAAKCGHYNAIIGYTSSYIAKYHTNSTDHERIKSKIEHIMTHFN